jgi:hypothetical protein
MNAVSDSSEWLDVGQVFGLEGLEYAPLERDKSSTRGFLIATVELQENGQVF